MRVLRGADYCRLAWTRSWWILLSTWDITWGKIKDMHAFLLGFVTCLDLRSDIRTLPTAELTSFLESNTMADSLSARQETE